MSLQLVGQLSTWSCAARCGWSLTRSDRDPPLVDVCPRCGAAIHWDPSGQPAPLPPSVLSLLRHALTEVLGEGAARYAPALLLALDHKHVALVPFDLRDDCPVWGRNGTVRAFVRDGGGRHLDFSLFKVEGEQLAKQLSFALGAVIGANAHNRLEADAAQRDAAAFLSTRKDLT